MSTMSDIFGPVIHAYTRAQAIADGALVDVTETSGGSREAGLRWPVAMTPAAHAATVKWDRCPGGNVEQAKPFTGDEESGRLWDVLTMLRMQGLPAACQQAQREGSARVPFQVLCVPPTGRGTRPRLTDLVLHLGPGDGGEPVLTVMLPSED